MPENQPSGMPLEITNDKGEESITEDLLQKFSPAFMEKTLTKVKKTIEETQGKDSYLWGQQLLIHSGRVLKDESTSEENNIKEDGFLVVTLSKSKASGSSAATAAIAAQTLTPAPAVNQPPTEAQPPAIVAPSSSSIERESVEVPVVGTQSSLSLTHTEIEETRERIREIYFTVFTHYTRNSHYRAFYIGDRDVRQL